MSEVRLVRLDRDLNGPMPAASRVDSLLTSSGATSAEPDQFQVTYRYPTLAMWS
ncbi:hypothetical protein [Streptomyces avermitilis]|uniref:hypothetical protein n=1 Tax=Streptomyces avermitilis TaxID=33903 RepID=UPI0036837029